MKKTATTKIYLLYILLFLHGPYAISSTPKDWMLTRGAYTAKIEKKGNDIVLTNGLVDRVFRNGVTIGLHNRITGEGLLRSIRPEAELTINDINIPVGGLTGQPIHNYFLPEWLEQMPPDPLSFRYVGYTESPIEKRFDWEPRKEWISQDPVWPPKGKMLTLTYKADKDLLEALSARYFSAENRDLLIDENFERLPASWTIQVSGSNKINSFTNEGKTGEILVNANTASYAESNLSPETEVLIARINPGTDKSASWGPGLSWIFDNKTVRIYLRTAENKCSFILQSGTGYS